jgi:5-methyltetrahydropteroyltriglutamate--homocysteine methyltransferase
MAILLPTSTAGSLPKPSWLAEPEKLWSPWKLEGEALIEAKQDALRLSLQEQIHAGIDIVSDGEQTRQHFVTHLSSILMAWILRSVKQFVSVIVMMQVFHL